MKIQKEVKHVDAYGIEIQIGDTVKVISGLPSYRYNLPCFNNHWGSEMDGLIGTEQEVFRLTDLGVETEEFWFPCFCLEILDKEQLIEDKLQEELDKNFGGDQSKMLREYYKKVYLKQD